MYVVLIILVLILLLLLMPIRAVIKKDDFYIQVLFIKWRAPEKKSKKQKQTESVSKENKSKKDIFRKIIILSDDIKALGAYAADKCIVFEQLRFNLDFGTDDAALTGILTGVINGIVYTILSVIHHNTTLKNRDISINPDFEREKFDIRYLCIVKVRLLHIIIIGIKALKLYKKYKKIKPEQE